MAGLSAKRKHLFYVELEKLVEAGFGIKEAAGVLLENRPSGSERKLLESLLAGLKQGRTIAESFQGGELSQMERGIITAGEKGGKLGPAFKHLADYFDLIARARRDAQKAMIYPLVLLHLGLLLAVIPSDVMGGGMSAAGILKDLVVALLTTYVLLAIVVMFVVWLLRLAPHHAAVDRLLNLLPLVGGARRNLAMARYTKVFHAGLLAGISMNETVTMASDAAHSGAIHEASKSLTAALKEGGSLGPVLISEKAFPSAFAKSFASAEESGMLDKDLQRWAKVFEDDAASSVKMLSVALPKLGYALIVVFVVWKLVSFYSGYYGSLEEIGI
ncbi:type II secretion system F family protein [Haloferula sp.]|uniref:type II secretion system F family protein n=1 Tax=Haloferula sp. TaxID=2497595 RepID=UPI00329FF57A